MLTHRPQTDRITLAWSGDPAFDVKRYEVKGKWTKESRTRWADAWRIAVETLDFAPLAKAGERPTYFHFRPLPEEARRHLVERYFGTIGLVGTMAVIRLCLIGVDDWPAEAPKLSPESRRVDPKLPELDPLLDPEVVQFLADLGRAAQGTRPLAPLIDELGDEVMKRGSPQGK